MRGSRVLAGLGLGLVSVLCAAAAYGQQGFRKGSLEFNAVRDLLIPAGKAYAVVVSEFFTQGALSPDGRSLAVFPRNGLQPLPSRLLQIGPGDLCRVAFQTAPGQSAYEICYGGDAAPSIPPWTNRDGLFMETREYVNCNLSDFDAVQKAFEKARPMGADYVENVFHSYNPFSLSQRPFMTRYSAVLHLPMSATFAFYTSSRDCSFVVVDGKVVASSPGRHGPSHQAKPDERFDVKLSSGPHPFEYYHAAAGPEAMMILAWEINPKTPKSMSLEEAKKPENKAHPEHLPPEVFRPSPIGHVLTEALSLKTLRGAPDFVMKIDGSAVLPDNEVPLVGVLFRDMTAKGLRGKLEWDFGDGQTSELADPAHVYLHPGLYKVKLIVKRQPANAESINSLYIDAPVYAPPRGSTENPTTYDDYLPVLMRYDAKGLDAASLRQLVAVFDAKASAIEAPPEDDSPSSDAKPEPKEARGRGRRAEKTEAEPVVKVETKEQFAARRAEATKWIARAVEAGKAAFVNESAAKGDEELEKLATTVGPMARDRLGESRLAFEIWKGAAQRIKTGPLKARCEIEAASIALNDLLDVPAARPLLEGAVAHLGSARPGAVLAALHRVRGDYFAATGDGKAARKEYFDSEKVLATTRTYVERNAWRGAHERSTEDFLKAREFDRAAAEIRAWENEFPSEKVDGQVTLAYAAYWIGREMYAQAIALCDQMLTVNPDSPYIDKMLLLTADCQQRLGKTDRALEALKRLVKNYRGSPLVDRAKEKIAELETGAKAKKPAGKRAAASKGT